MKGRVRDVRSGMFLVVVVCFLLVAGGAATVASDDGGTPLSPSISDGASDDHAEDSSTDDADESDRVENETADEGHDHPAEGHHHDDATHEASEHRETETEEATKTEDETETDASHADHHHDHDDDGTDHAVHHAADDSTDHHADHEGGDDVRTGSHNSGSEHHHAVHHDASGVHDADGDGSAGHRSSGDDHHAVGGEFRNIGLPATGHDHTHEEAPTGAWMTTIGLLFAASVVTVTPVYWTARRRHRVAPVHALEGFALALALLTGAVHLYLYVHHGGFAMLLAGMGFVGAAVLFLLGVDRRSLYAAGVPFVAIQIYLWWAAGTPHVLSYGLFDKVVQSGLLVLLCYLFWREL